ncbi:MAG: helix-turn-helix transcriptional regulator [Anaerolineae bacterium]|nr:helix-turn-helix transcriptional regulator [Anaerolineae bacterium]
MIQWRLSRIRHLRMKKSLTLGKKFTQEDLAQAIGVHRSTILRYENDEGGDIGDPDIGIVARLAEYFDVPMSFFYDEEGDAGNKSRATSTIEVAQLA